MVFEAYSDRVRFTCFFSGAYLAAFGGLNLFFGMCHCLHVFEQYKIQGPKMPSISLIWWSVLEAAVNAVLMIPIAWVIFPLFNTSMNLHLPGLLEVLVQCGTFALLNDTLFYWSHRLLHTQFLYGAIHKKHHTFHVVVGSAAVYAHPIENAISLVTTLCGPIWLVAVFFPVRMTTTMLWIFLATWESTEAHSGYALPFSPFSWIGVSTHHDFHHSHNMGCFGGWFALWDRFCGTDQAFKAYANRIAGSRGADL